jgi:regulatory protein
MTPGNEPDSGQDPAAAKAKSRKTGPKIPRKVTADRLRNIALYHLERYATSADNLRQVLYRRVLKAARHHETDMDQARAWIDDIVGGLVRARAVDDRSYADGKARSMSRRGQSKRKIQAYLASKGVDRDTIDAALSALGEDDGNDPDLDAAHAYARRRRIGPYRRDQESTPDLRQKELATLARAGFSYDIARQILDADPQV